MATEIAKAYVQIVPKAEGITGNIAKAIDPEAESAGKSAGGKLTSSLSGSLKTGIGVAAKAVGAGIVAASAGITALAKTSIGSYAEYEQLVGGVETLFKDSASNVMSYANDAYKTAGLSANSYMETVTSFSASLLQSMGGDTAAAADKAHTAIVDMSDNANKMGSNMQDIQNAYQGFAKQNYTMLDNLKLGYGGTKQEMQRLLEDAGKISGIEYNIDSYADVVDAIHVMQESMDIAGTTAKEAESTISGSIGMMKGSWTNFITGLADGSQDLDTLFDNFINSVGVVGDNLIPRIQELAPRLVEGVTRLGTALMPKIPPLISSLLPSLIEGSVGLITGLVQQLPQLLSVLGQSIPMIASAFKQQAPALMQVGADLITMIVNGLITNVPTLLQKGVDVASELIRGLGDGLARGIPEFLANALPIILQFSEQLRANAGQLVDAGLELITQIAHGLINSIPVLIEYIPTIVSNIAGIINDNAPKVFETGVTLLVELGNGIIHSIPLLIANAPQIVSAVVDVITAFNWVSLGSSVITGIKNGISAMTGAVKGAASNVGKGILNAFKSMPSSLRSFARNGLSNIKNAFTSSGLANVASNVMTAVKNAFKNKITDAFNVVKSIISKIKGLFRFSWSLPHISLPHFSINPSGWKIGDLLKGSIPTLGISWYDKGGVFDRPSVIGVGEKRPEFVGALDDLRTIVREESGQDMTRVLADMLIEMKALRNGMFETIVRALKEMNVKFDERELARLVRKYA